MFTAATALKKFLTGKTTTTFVLFDEDGDEYISVSEAEWNKRKTVPHFLFDDGAEFFAEDLGGGTPAKLSYDDKFVAVAKVKRINLVEVGNDMLHPDDVKKMKKLQRLRVDLTNEIGYTLDVTPKGIKIGCQDHTWAEWERDGKQIVNNYFRYRDTETTVQNLLALVLENKNAIIARLSNKVATKKTVKKVAAKKTVKKVAKKATKKTAKRK